MLFSRASTPRTYARGASLYQIGSVCLGLAASCFLTTRGLSQADFHCVNRKPDASLFAFFNKPARVIRGVGLFGGNPTPASTRLTKASVRIASFSRQAARVPGARVASASFCKSPVGLFCATRARFAIAKPNERVASAMLPKPVKGKCVCCFVFCCAMVGTPCLLVPAPTVGACNTGIVLGTQRVATPTIKPRCHGHNGACVVQPVGACVVYGTHGQPVPVCARFVCQAPGARCVPVGAQRGLCSATRGGNPWGLHPPGGRVKSAKHNARACARA